MDDFINGYFTTSAAEMTTADYARCVKKNKRKRKRKEKTVKLKLVKLGLWLVVSGGISCFPGMLGSGNLAGALERLKRRGPFKKNVAVASCFCHNLEDAE